MVGHDYHACTVPLPSSCIAENFIAGGFARGTAAFGQLKGADLLLLNKVDLVDMDTLAQVRKSSVVWRGEQARA